MKNIFSSIIIILIVCTISSCKGGEQNKGTSETNNTNTSTNDNIGKVIQDGSKFTTFNTNGRQVTYFSSPNKELIGWGKDFFVIRQRDTFYTYDIHCKQFSSITIGGSANAKVSVQGETFTVNNRKYNKHCKAPI